MDRAYARLAEKQADLDKNVSSDTNQTTVDDWLSNAAPIHMILFILSESSLVILVISYFAISKLRRSEAGQMVLNMSFSLMLHYITLFIFGLYTFAIPEVQSPALCVTVQTFIVYTGLVLVFLMAAEAVNMFFKIVLVFKTITSYVVKATLVAWITPIFLIGFTTSVTFYGFIAENRCTPVKMDLIFDAPMYSFGVLLQLSIWVIFIIIALTMLKNSRQAVKTQNYATRPREIRKNLKVLMTLSVLFGLPWMIVMVGFFLRAIPNIGGPMLFVAGVIDFSQGFMLFLVQGARLTEVQQLWKKWLCCRCREPDPIVSQQMNGSLSTIDRL